MTLSNWQYITQGENPEEHLVNAEQVIIAGCHWVQLRLKDEEDSVILETAKAFKKLCKKHLVLCIINDNVQVAHNIQADGVHLGKNDMPPSEARVILGKKAIIGGTANTFEDIIYLSKQGVDYIGLGPFTFTTTKKKLSPVLGLGGYKEIIQKMQDYEIDIPVHAIGGITLNDISSLMETGITGIAVSGLITHSADKKTLVNHINSFIKGSN